MNKIIINRFFIKQLQIIPNECLSKQVFDFLDSIVEITLHTEEEIRMFMNQFQNKT